MNEAPATASMRADMDRKPLARTLALSASLSCAFTLVAAAGCDASEPMAVDKSLAAASERHDVAGKAKVTRKQPMTFGSYTTQVTKGGMPRKVSVGSGPWSKSTVKQNFEFTTTGGATGFSGNCAFNDAEHNIGVSISEGAAFGCSLLPNGQEVWALTLGGASGVGKGDALGGKIERGGQIIEVHANDTLEGGKSGNNVGFEFVKDGQVVGAVQTAGEGTVWMATSTDPETRDLLAASASSLLISHKARQMGSSFF